MIPKHSHSKCHDFFLETDEKAVNYGAIMPDIRCRGPDLNSLNPRRDLLEFLAWIVMLAAADRGTDPFSYDS
jgi:hypothetical protein